MKNFEERYTAWLDDALDERENAEFEKELPEAGAAARDREEWRRLRGLMREAIDPARMPHADFVNSQVLAAIQRETKVAPHAGAWVFPLPRLAFAGVFFLLLAGILSIVFLSGSDGDVPTVSEVVVAQPRDAHTHAYAFDAPGRAAVLWIDNAGYIPANERL